MTRSQWVLSLLTLVMLTWAILEVRGLRTDSRAPRLAGDSVTLDGPGWQATTDRLYRESDADYAARIRNGARMAQEEAKAVKQ